MKKVILFDLDGTIINSQEGVTKSVQYALAKMGIDEPDLEKLRVFIGPPLQSQFQNVYGFTKEQAWEAVQKYRERYKPIGIYECELYPYVEEILGHLKEWGYLLALASSKPENACLGILEHFGIDGYFDLVGGATEDGRISEKEEVLRDVMERLGMPDTGDYVLVGDTRFDVEGAQVAGIDCIGVTYGFGTAEELRKAGAIEVFDSLQEVEAYFEKK